MDPDSRKSPRSPLRFGFHGRRKTVSSNSPVRVESTEDEILDSLTRQAALREGLLTKGKGGAEEIFGSEVIDDSGDQQTTPAAPARIEKDRGLGRYAFILMLLGGISMLGLYGFLTRTIDPSLLNRIIQYSNVQTIFAQPLRIGIIAASALLAGLWIAQKRKR